jgi:PAS domain S-box-containing protein
MKKKINILAIEDSEDDLLLNIRAIEQGGYEPSYERVETPEAMSASLSAKEWDVIISDHKMPHFDSFKALEILKESGKDIPFIIVSGTIGEETAVAAMKAGAGDYLMKNNLKRLAPAIERELSEAEVRRKRKDAEERQRVSLHIIELLNRTNDTRAIIGDILAYLKQATGLDAVGLRLRKGEDYPYFVQIGFSGDHIEPDSSLCRRDGTGSCMRDESGNPYLECICGQILMKRFGPDRSFYTGKGSFWSGDVEAVLALPEMSELGRVFRTRLGEEGYRSVAIIPLASGDEIIGLLLMYDRRAGRIDGDMVRFFEGIGASIGIALKRRQLEDEIREREQTYRLIADNMSDIIWLSDMNYKYIFMTPSMERVRGFTMDDMNAMPMGMNYTPESFSYFLKVMSKELAPERLARKDLVISRTLELEVTRKDGPAFWAEIRFEVIRDQEGTPVAILGTGRNISERKGAEEQIKKSEARYRAVAEDAPLLICRFLPDGTITFVNNAYCRFFGKKQDELIGTDINQFKYKEDREDFSVAVRSATRENPIARLENRVVASDGSLRWMRWTGRAMFRNNRITECQALGEDITEEKHFHEVLIESEERFRQLADSMPQLVWTARADGNVDYINRRYEEFAGYSRDEKGNWQWEPAIYDEDAAGAREAWRRSLETGDYYEAEFRLRRKDGEFRWHLSRAVPVKDEKGRIIKWYGTSTDITDLKSSEDRIAASLREKEVLLKEIHHRVKNNLQVMSSLIGLQAGYIKRGADMQSALKDMQNRIKSMAIVHERLYQSMDFSSINFKAYINSLIANVFQSLGIDSGRIRVITQVEDVSMGINNAIPCGLLLNELLTNAVKHAFPGGRSGKVVVSMVREDDGSFRLSVKDDGVGLPEGGVDIGNSKSLGFNLLQILTKQIGGTLSVESGNGAEFIVTFKDELERPK